MYFYVFYCHFSVFPLRLKVQDPPVFRDPLIILILYRFTVLCIKYDYLRDVTKHNRRILYIHIYVFIGTQWLDLQFNLHYWKKNVYKLRLKWCTSIKESWKSFFSLFLPVLTKIVCDMRDGNKHGICFRRRSEAFQSYSTSDFGAFLMLQPLIFKVHVRLRVSNLTASSLRD